MRRTQTSTLISTFAVLALCVALASCGDTGSTAACTDGASMACVAADGGAGTQTCVGGGWGACVPSAACVTDQSEQCTTACGTTGVRTCLAGAWGACTSMAVEQCNGTDDDCDGVVDEDMAAVPCNCGAAVGTKACIGGTFSPCTAGDAANAELCDNQDNNCNGQVDEGVTKPCTTDCGDGVETCYYGEWGECDAPAGTPEVCDNKDNDCNGAVDDGLGDLTCGLGECEHTAPACVGGVAGTCDPMEGSVAEICDQDFDNDCDGETDEGLLNCCNEGAMGECSSNTGECEKGTWTCGADGSWGTCTGKLPSDELCDGKDNDCDGAVDDGNPGGGAVCGSDIGECEKGIETCVGGVIVCQGEKTASTEVCDGKDNDCDDTVDDGLSVDEYETNEACNNGFELEDLEEEAEEPAAFAGNLYKGNGGNDEDWYKIHFNEASDLIPPCGFSFNDMCYLLDFELLQAVDGQEFCVKTGDCADPDFEACGGAEDFLVIGWAGTWGLNDDQDIYIQVKGAQTCSQYSVEVTPYSICPNDGLCPWEDGYVEPGN
ncbi:MAG: MopE-related protein [Pseudomonadota bacterium]